MIGVIRPLVKESKKDKWLRFVGVYGFGALLSSATLGASAGAAGTVLAAGPRWPAVALVGSLGLLLAAGDLGMARGRTISARRQTCPTWFRLFGPTGAWWFWGLDLGLGFSTIRVASSYWISLAMAFVLGSAVLGAVVLGAYGTGLALNLVIAGLFLIPNEGNTPANVHAVGYRGRFRKALGAVTVVLSVLLLLSSRVS